MAFNESTWSALNTSWPDGDDVWLVNLTEGVGQGGNGSDGAELGSRNQTLVVWEIVTLVSIFLMTVAGNMVVLLLLLGRRKKLTRMCYFILSLCLSDLITAFFNVLPQIIWEVTYRFRGGSILCKAVKFLQLLGPYLNSYLLVMTALDRYQVICYPLSSCTWTPRRSKNMIYLAWVMALGSCTPQLFVFSFQDVGGGTWDCWASFIPPWGPRAYVTWYAISVFILPLCLLVVAYTCICHTLWTNFRLKQQDERNPRWRRSQRPGLIVRLRSRTSHPSSSQVSTCIHAPHSEDTSTSLLLTPMPGATTTGAENVTVRAGGGVGSRSVKPRAHSTRSISRAKIKTVKLTVTVIFCYISCSAPFISVQLWHVWDPHATQSPFYSGAAFTILMLLSSLNSVVNPWIFLAFNENLSHLLGSLCTCRFVNRGEGGRSFGGNRRSHHQNTTFRSSDSNKNFRLTVFTTTEADPPHPTSNPQCETSISPGIPPSPQVFRRLSPSNSHSPMSSRQNSTSRLHPQSPSFFNGSEC